MHKLITDLCNENKWLNTMYTEIRDSPLAAESKQEYENTIADWKQKYADLQKQYNNALDEIDSLHAENAKLQRRWEDW